MNENGQNENAGSVNPSGDAENFGINNDNYVNPPQGPAGYSGETDVENGEYHYKNGFTQKMYSDAHYVPADESTVPPRYYAPPERQPREPKPRVKKPVNKNAVKIVALCLVFTLLGGLCGGAIVRAGLSDRISNLESDFGNYVDKEENAVLTTSKGSDYSGVSGVVSGLAPYEIYAEACKQVVGITSEITYTNFFGMSSSSAVSGSGFVVSANGYILTNFHVIEAAVKSDSDISVMLHDGTKYKASVVGAEPENDIAVLKIEADGLVPATLGNSGSMKVGDAVYAVGNPLGELEFSMTTGHVSALDRVITTEENSDSINMFQFDAAVNPGNSGGPVYNSEGEVVGIVTAKYSSSGVEGLGFAVPINDAAAIANDLITKGYVTGKARMGVQLDNRFNSMYSQYYGMPIGAYVASVESGSCAEKAGIQTGDIITKLGDNIVEGYADLRSAVKQYRAGDTAEITLYRAGESMTVKITFDEAKPGTMSKTGTERRELPPQIAG
ncbi:MAG: S1C family serine protease [Candidatus Limivicinus sp.]|jgi:serine protease Do